MQQHNGMRPVESCRYAAAIAGVPTPRTEKQGVKNFAYRLLPLTFVWCLVLSSGCQRANKPGSTTQSSLETRTSAEITFSRPAAIHVKIEGPEDIRFYFRNLSKTPVLICRSFEHPNYLLIEKQDGNGLWRKLEHVDADEHDDPRSPADFDWVCLEFGGEVSWPLLYNWFGGLKSGDNARITWKTGGKPPECIKNAGSVFPSKEFVQIVKID